MSTCYVSPTRKSHWTVKWQCLRVKCTDIQKSIQYASESYEVVGLQGWL